MTVANAAGGGWGCGWAGAQDPTFCAQNAPNHCRFFMLALKVYTFAISASLIVLKNKLTESLNHIWIGTNPHSLSHNDHNPPDLLGSPTDLGLRLESEELSVCSGVKYTWVYHVKHVLSKGLQEKS